MRIIVGMVSANERRRYIVTPPLIGWAHTRMISAQGGFINPCAWLHWVTDKLCRQVVGLQGGMEGGDSWVTTCCHDALKSEQNGWHFADNIFKHIFLCILIWLLSGDFLQQVFLYIMKQAMNDLSDPFLSPFPPPLVHTSAIIQWYFHDFANPKEGLRRHDWWSMSPCHPLLWLLSCMVTYLQVKSLMDHFVYVPSQWEMMLHCNIISHWLGIYTKWTPVTATHMMFGHP